ncbi:MAG: ATP-binding protein [Chitinophagaceae bacterium]
MALCHTACHRQYTADDFRTDKPDLAAVDRLRDTFYLISNSDHLKAISYSKKILDLVRHSSREDLAAEAYNDLAALSRMTRQFDNCRLYIDTLYQIAEKTHCDTVLRMAYTVSGDLYRDLDELDSSAIFLVKALKIPQPLNTFDKKRLYSGLAKTTSLQKNFRLAMQYYEPLIRYARDTLSPSGISIMLNAYVYAHTIDSDARRFLFEGLEMSYKQKDSSFLCAIYSNLSDDFLHRNQPDSAEKYIRMAVSIGEKLQLPRRRTEKVYLEMLLILTSNKKFEEAATLLRRVEQTVDTALLSAEDKYGLAYIKSQIFLYKKQDRNAISALEEALKFQEKELKNINISVINDYEKELKKLGAEKTITQQHALISKQRSSNILLLTLLAASLAGAFSLIYFRVRERKLEKQKLEQIQKEKELENQEKLLNERKRISREMHDDLGSTLTSTLMAVQLVREGNTDDWTLSIIEESANKLHLQVNEIIWNLNTQNDTLRNLSSFIISFAKKFITEAGIGFRWEEHLAEPERKIDGYQRRNIYLCAKEALNNLVKHAQANQCMLRVEADSRALLIIISDNGLGIPDQPVSAADERPHYGLDNLKRRMEQIGGSVEWTGTPGGGTTVTIYFPFQQ